MSCTQDPATVAWNRALARFYGIMPATLEHDNGHDISSMPSRNSIQLGTLFRASDRKLKRQKILHEYQHVALGMTHDDSARKIGYFSDPGRDKFTRELLPQVERAMNSARRMTNPAYKNPKTVHFTVNEVYAGKGRSAIIAFLLLRNGDIVQYQRDSEKQRIATEEHRTYMKRGFQDGMLAHQSQGVIKLSADGISLSAGIHPTEAQWQVMRELDRLNSKKVYWSIHAPYRTRSGDGPEDEEAGDDPRWADGNGIRDLQQHLMGRKIHKSGSALYWHQLGDEDALQNPWVTISDRTVLQRVRNHPEMLSSYWMQRDGSFALFGLKDRYEAADEWPIHGTQVSNWTGADTSDPDFEDRMQDAIKREGVIRVQGEANFELWGKPSAAQKAAMLQQMRDSEHSAGGWDLWNTATRSDTGSGSGKSLLLASSSKKVASGYGDAREFEQALSETYEGGRPMPRKGSAAYWHQQGGYDFTGMKNPVTMADLREELRRLQGRSSYIGLTKQEAGRLRQLEQIYMEATGKSFAAAPRSRFMNPHQLFPKEANYALKKITDPYQAFKGSTAQEDRGLHWLSQHRLTWTDRDGFYHLNDRGMDAWLHASSDHIEMSPVPLFSKYKFGPAKPMEILAPRRKRTAKPVVEFESDLPVQDTRSVAEKLGKIGRIRKSK